MVEEGILGMEHGLIGPGVGTTSKPANTSIPAMLKYPLLGYPEIDQFMTPKWSKTGVPKTPKYGHFSNLGLPGPKAQIHGYAT